MLRIWFFVLMYLAPFLAFGGDNGDRAVIDWSRWDLILRSHVVDGTVDYDAIASDSGFSAILTDIASANLEGSDRDSTLAFYINAYNVLAVQAILNGRSPGTKLGKLRFFFRDKYTIAGEKLSLHALEKRRIRSLGEPRIHFAIVCASHSCPPLRPEAYLPQRLDMQLEGNVRRFVNDPAKNRFDLDTGVAHVSKIFKWFAEDFESSAGSVRDYIAGYIDDARVATQLREGRFKLRYLEYDWSVNGSYDGAKR